MKKIIIIAALLLSNIGISGVYAQNADSKTEATRDNSKDFIVSHKIYREKTIKTDNGIEKKIREDVKTSIPGEELIGVMSYKYANDKPADNFILTLPIAKELMYVEGSATDEKWVWFSADGGKTFSRFKNLKVLDANGIPKIALGKDVTHLQWRRASEMKKGESGTLEYRVIVR